MTLSELIEELERHDPGTVVAEGFGEPMSFRGDYEELAFEPASNVTVGSMLEYARSALGKTFEGYKGGEYTMGQHTDCWIAPYGEGSGPETSELSHRLLRLMLKP